MPEKMIITLKEITSKPANNGHKMLSLTDWRKEVEQEPASDDLIQNVLPNSPSEYMIVCGRSGIGKTNLALHQAFSLASGKPWFSFKTKKCKVGYLLFEGAPKKVLIRVDKLLKAYPEVEGNLHFERSLPFKLTGPGVSKFKAMIDGLDVIFIDPLRYNVPGDYTKPEYASNYISTLKSISQEIGVVPVLLHHVKKPDPRLRVRPEDLQYEVKGATDYVDAAGTLLLIEKARQSRGHAGQFGSNNDDRTLHFCKVKDSPSELYPLNLHFNRETLLYEPITLDYQNEDDF